MKYDIVNAIVIAIAGDFRVLRASPPAWVGLKAVALPAVRASIFVRAERRANEL